MKDIKWLTFSESIAVEYEQSKDEGRLVDCYQEDVSFINEKYQSGVLMEQEAAALFKKIQSAPISEDYIYQEPSDLESIKKLCINTTEKKLMPKIDKEVLRQKIYGAWLARCAGCLLGQPVEGWYRSRITGFLDDTNNFLPRAYFASNVSDNIRKKYNITDAGHVYGSTFINWINNVKCAPEDDDTNYTIIGLKTLEENGKDFTSPDMAHSWLMNMQFLHACTAERVAYRNFVNLIEPPYSASYNNAYREWIGAQIRADIFGYVCPGDIEAAAALAWKDACISHTKNGIYGEMFVAAMISKAAVCNDISLIIEAGLSQIPSTSRLYAATTGSIIGMLLGAQNLPKHWIDPLNDTLKSGIDGFNVMKISELAERSLNIALK